MRPLPASKVSQSSGPTLNDLVVPSSGEIERLKSRVRRLAEEKSYLQLVLRMIEQISHHHEGVANMVTAMLQSIIESIGGTNIKIWYWIDEDMHFASFLDENKIVTEIDDPIAAAVRKNREFVETCSDGPNSMMHGDVLPGAWTWCFPLLVGSNLMGVIKLENVHISGASLRNFLPIFFSHAALILSNEIRDHLHKKAELALNEKTEELDNYFNSALDLFCIADTDGYFIKLNPVWSRVLGYEQDYLKGKNFLDFVHPDDLAATLDAVKSLSNQNAVIDFVNRYRHKDGSWRWIEWRSQPKGNLIFAAACDITEKKKSADALMLSASVFTHAREAIVITDAEGTILDINDAFTRITGYNREDAIGQNPRILSSGRYSKDFYSAMWRDLSDNGNWYGEIWNRRKSGEVYAEMLTISAVRDDQGKIRQYVALFSDITALKDHQQQLEHVAHYDSLTGLPNRVLLRDRLHQAMVQAQRRGKHLAVVFLDLDGFKAINDTHGHDAGDKMLIALATNIKDALREGDTLARLGGDEFVAVLPDLPNPADITPLLTRMLSAASAPVAIGGDVLTVSASLGVTFYPQVQDVDADQLVRQADQAMYQAKMAGKSRYHFFDTEQDSSLRVYHESLERIRLALKQCEFVLYYQPKVNMRTGKVIGAEALIRWQHPERGLLAPALFLPVIENHPLAIAIGEWVIDSALTQMEAWRAVGLEIPISVNVGACQLQQENFSDRLQTILAEHPLVDPSLLELEILETSALEDVTKVSKLIKDCSQIGVTFALDDFGTGYSSLTYLKRLPVGMLKIDQSFVRDMLNDPDDLAILQGIIGLAASFKRQVIAEGVESVEHGNLLLQLGCDLAQGYGIARPMPAEEFPAWATGWSSESAWSTPCQPSKGGIVTP